MNSTTTIATAIDPASVCYGAFRPQKSIQARATTRCHDLHAVTSKTASRLSRMAGAVAKLRGAFKIEVSMGYEDENGFHYGVPPAEKKIAWPPVG